MPDPAFTGSGVALVTPFSDGGLDAEAMRELVRFQLREGTSALIVNGSTGEAATMTPAEQRQSVETVVDEAGGHIPVIAGCGGSDTAVVVELARGARAAGADGLLVSPPPYNKPQQRGILAHYRAILDAADLPLIVYNVPGRTACNILPATIEELASDPRLVGVKEASSDISQIGDLCRRLADRLAIYSGNDDQVVPLLALGGKGVISVLANIAPAAVAEMVGAFHAGDLATARQIQLRHLPLIAALFREPNPVPAKAGLAAMGYSVGGVRLPLVPISDELREQLLSLMREADLLAPLAAAGAP